MVPRRRKYISSPCSPSLAMAFPAGQLNGIHLRIRALTNDGSMSSKKSMSSMTSRYAWNMIWFRSGTESFMRMLYSGKTDVCAR